MGNGNGLNNNQNAMCFNAAKSFELQWYADRTQSVRPALAESFQGKLIGVADYGNSASDHTVVLEIQNEDPSIQSYFMTFNTAKGITINTAEAANKVTIVQGAAELKSNLVAKLGANIVHRIPFYQGRDLIISLGAAAQDGNVDYIPLTVELESQNCATDNDCIDSFNSCMIGSCMLGQCSYILDTFCCGNGICEAVDGGCGACAEDCSVPTNCNEIDGVPDSQTGGFFSTSTYGIAFDVIMTENVYFYEIEADLVQNSQGIPAKVYTKNGSYSTDSDLTTWELVFDGVSTTPDFYKSLMRFNSRAYSAAGTTRAFYISYETSGAFVFGFPGEVVSNNDGQIFPAILLGEQTFTGSTFYGGVKYDYEIPTPSPTPLPTPSPTPLPTPSPNLTDNPGGSGGGGKFQ
jgi:hypothetical protein